MIAITKLVACWTTCLTDQTYNKFLRYLQLLNGFTYFNTCGLCDILSAQILHDHSIICFPLGLKTVLQNNEIINLCFIWAICFLFRIKRTLVWANAEMLAQVSQLQWFNYICFLFQDVKTAKDWVESLHGKIDLLSTVMNIIETRLDAIESGIRVVPLSLQPQAAEISYSHTVQSSATSRSIPPLPPSVTITLLILRHLKCKISQV